MLLRRMRAPLITVIIIYSIAILGFVLIPGMDAEGKPWRMSFFHAFYFVSFMGSTIGFGELPYPFTNGQRLWTLFSIYGTVVAWLYAIGSMLTVIQDTSFRRVINRNSFDRAVRRIKEPFYLICGYGDTGNLLIRALAKRGIRCVVIDIEQECIDALELEDKGIDIPGLCADASDPDNLIIAGLKRPQCTGVIALTNIDHINLSISISSKRLVKNMRVISRVETHDAEANMASFGTDYTINAYDTFATYLATAIHSPSKHLLYDWMTSGSNAPLTEPIMPPHGKWVLCGYGRFGKALRKNLLLEDIDPIIVELDPEGTHAPRTVISGRGTEASTLHDAGIENAVGVIAGTNNDTNNLSIIMTALDINRDLFTVARQNKSMNDHLYELSDINLIMQRANIIARKISTLIMTPMLDDFLRLLSLRDNQWANILVSRISGLTGELSPHLWSVRINNQESPALIQYLKESPHIVVGDLLRDPRKRENKLDCLVLLLKQQTKEILVPDITAGLHEHDELLICGQQYSEQRVRWIQTDYNVLSYVKTGIDRPSGTLWRWLAKTTQA